MKPEAAIHGFDAIMHALEQVEPKLQKASMRELRKVASTAGSKARASYPSNQAMPSGFTYVNASGAAPVSHTSRKRAFPRYDQGKARAGVKVTTRQGNRKMRSIFGQRFGFVNMMGLTLDDAAGAILETAGTKWPNGRTPAGGRLIGAFSDVTGVASQLYKVVLPQIIAVRADVTGIAKRAEAAVTRVGR